MHPIQDIHPNWKSPLINCIIEIPQGSRIKYEVDKVSGLIKMDRLLSSSFEYPVNYGFIPQTLGEDGDPLDILLITYSPLVPLCFVEARVIGLMQMVDRGISDDKIIAVANTDITQSHIHSIADLSPHFFKELENFFEEYTKLENKKVEVNNFESLPSAENSIQIHLERYLQSRNIMP